MPQHAVIGIDGGATHSFGVAVDLTGKVVAAARAGSLNYFGATIADARRNLSALVKSMKSQLPASFEIDEIVVGTAALFTEAAAGEKEQLCRRILPLDKTRVVSDCLTAFHGATLGQPGALVISGTGSIVLAQNESGALCNIGGWGHILGDAGSAYWIALESVKAVIAASEGLGQPTAMSAIVYRWFDVNEPAELVPVIYDPGFTKEKFAALAQFLFEHGGADDAVYREICRRAGGQLAAQTIAAVQKSGLKLAPVPVYLAGGVLNSNHLVRESLVMALNEAGQFRIEQPQLSPLLGAAALALGEAGIRSTPEIVAALKASYNDLAKRRPPRAGLRQPDHC